MPRNSRRPQPKFAFSMCLRWRNHSDRGFSLLELLVVVGMSLVIAGMAVPSVMRAIYNVRLRSSASSLAGLLQNARMTAVKTNTIVDVHYTPQGSSTEPYMDYDCSGTLSSGDQVVQLGGNTTVMETPTGTGAPPQLDTTAGITNSQSDPSFNSRGLPVQRTSCGGAVTTNVGFIYYLMDTRPGGNGWAAVSITPAGRIKTWSWNGTAWTN